MRASLLAPVALLSAALAQDREAQLREAGRLVSDNQLDKAIELLDRTIAEFPREHRALEIRAAAHSRRGDFDGAIADATAAIELAVDSWRAHFERGFARYHKRQLAAALVDYDKAAELAPEVAAIHGERGDLLAEMDEPAAAVESYTRAIRLAPRWTEAWTGRGRARASLGDHSRALADLKRAKAIGTDPSVSLTLARIAVAAGQDELARRTLAEWLAATPPGSRSGAHVTAARTMWGAGDRAAALGMLDEGTSRAVGEPGFAELGLTRACLRLGSGATAAALDELQGSANGAPVELRPYIDLMLWCCRARLQGLDSADTDLRKVSATWTQVPQTQRLLESCLGNLAHDEAPRDGAPAEACPRDFFAGWRAQSAGDAASARRLWLRSVATGASEWLQWHIAVDCLRAMPDGAKLEPTLGLTLEFGKREQLEVAWVKAVARDSAAELHGLAAGDELVGLFQAPVTVARWREIEATARVGAAVSLTVRRAGKESVRWLCFGLTD